jgi:hypothetical protein
MTRQHRYPRPSRARAKECLMLRVDEQIFTIHSRRLHLRLLASFLGTQSKDMKRFFWKGRVSKWRTSP